MSEKKSNWKTTLAGILGGSLTGTLGVLELTNGNIDNKQGWLMLGAAVAQGALGYLASDKEK